MSAVDPRELEGVLLDHGLRIRSTTASCLSVRCPWTLTLAAMDGSWELYARRAHVQHLIGVLVADGLIELMGPAELRELDLAG